MAGVSRKPEGDRSMEYQGLLNNLQDWDHMLKLKDQKSKDQGLKGKKTGSLRNAGEVDEDKGPPKKVPANETKKKIKAVSELSPRDYDERYNILRYPDALGQISSSILKDESSPDAASEKDLGNEYFKQKKFHEAIKCYSRSIALSPTAVAFANRAMSYLKIKRFEEAENDCTEALNLDDRYVKAYSRRATARKELGRLKASIEDSEFAMRLEPNNQELRKQYTETKELYAKEIAMKTYGASRAPIQGIQRVGSSEMGSKDVRGVHLVSSNVQKATASAVQTNNVDNSGKISRQPLVAVMDIDSRITSAGVETREHLLDASQEVAAVSFSNDNGEKHDDVDCKHELKASMQDIASRAASRVMATAAKCMTAPKSAYEFEVSWRALSDDPTLQVNLLKIIPPATLPGIFKNALSAPMLVGIVRCTATIFKEDTELAVTILDNLAKVPRFDMIVMCLSAVDRAGLRRIWDEVFSSKDIQVDHAGTLGRLRPKYLYG